MTSGKIILVSAFLVFCLWTAIAQLNLDSLNQIMLTAKDDTAKVNLLVMVGRTALFRPVSTFPYGDQVISISKKINYPIGLVNGYRLNGAYYSEFRNDLPKGLKYYQMADSICHLYNGPEFTEGLGAVQYCYGNIQLHCGNTAQAVQFYIKALQILET